MLKIDDPDKNLGPLGEWMIRHYRSAIVLLVALTGVLLVWCFVIWPAQGGSFATMTLWTLVACLVILRIGKIRALRDGRPPRPPST